MSRLDVGFALSGPVDDAGEQMRGLALRSGFRVQNEDGDASRTELTAKQGSQFVARLLGAWFVPFGWLPKRLSMTAAAEGERTRVEFRLSEAMSKNIFDPRTRRRYERAFAELREVLSHEAEQAYGWC